MSMAKITATLAVAAKLGAAGFAFSQPSHAQTPPPADCPGDFGGHHEKAADLCRQAQDEIKPALQSDKL